MSFRNSFGKFENLRCGLIHLIENLPAPVPLKKVNLNVKIVDFVAEVNIEQDYVNYESNPIEVLYSFPVEESAAIIGFNAIIDDHEIEGEVKKKGEAKADYDQAMLDGNSAMLLDETAPDIFSMKLGQLKPGSGATIKLTYIMELPIEEKSIRLTIPTTIAPRYIPPSDDSEAAKEIAKLTYKIDDPAPLNIKIQTLSQGQIQKITSPSHDLTHSIQEKANDQGQFEAESSLINNVDIMNRDLVLMIKADNIDKPTVFVEKSGDSQAALVSLIPSFKLDEQKVELIFLVDRSGSMGGSSIEQAKKALQVFLHSMPANCYFNIWSFGSQFSALFENGSQMYDDDSLAKAKNHVNLMDANYGGTEVFSPLEAIFKAKEIPGFAKQIFLLTDGAVSNDDAVLKLVKKNAKSTRVFTLGLGSSASRHLVKGVARVGNGTPIFASLSEDLRPKVLTLLKNSLMPSLTNLEVLWNGKKKAKTEKSSVRSLFGFNKDVSEEQNQDQEQGVLFDGSRLLSFKIFDQNEPLDKVIITAQAPDGPLSVTIPITEQCHLKSGNFLHQMAARRQIQDLEESNPYLNDEIRDQLTNLALKHKIASKYTSFIGIDKKTKKQVLESAMESRQIQQQVPYGFGGAFGYVRHSAVLRKSLKKPMFKSARNCSMPQPRALMAAPPAMAYAECAHEPMSANFDLDCAMVVKDCGRKSKMKKRSAKANPEPVDLCEGEMDCLNWSGEEMDVLDSAVPEDDLTALIGLQMANGCFKFGKVLEKLTGLSEEEIKTKMPSEAALEAWLTALAICILEKKFPKEKDVWSLIKNKANKFLESQGNAQDLLKSADSVF